MAFAFVFGFHKNMGGVVFGFRGGIFEARVIGGLQGLVGDRSRNDRLQAQSPDR